MADMTSVSGERLRSYIERIERLEEEKKALIHALKQYCELDTLAMVFIYEHWLSVKEDIC